MTIYTLSKCSSINTTLTDPGGSVAYEISTPFRMGDSQTTIKRGDQVVAIIAWKWFKPSTITMNGTTTAIKEIFPTSKKLSVSRVWTMPNGDKFKWKDRSNLYCVSLDTGLNLATYDRGTLGSLFRGKPTTLDIAAGTDTQLAEALVVTWVIAEKMASDRAASASGG